MIRLNALALFVIIGLVSPAAAEEPVRAPPEVVIGGDTAAHGATGAGKGGGAADGPDRCVEVQIGSSRAMDCLNQKLKRDVERVKPTMNLPPVDARSPDTKTGVVNIPGVAQQYGKNFGVSAVPFRPAPPIFTSPMGSHR